jgi:hypothetical protein
MHACCHARKRRRFLAKRLELLDDLLAKKSAITTIRIELCSAASTLSLRSLPTGFGLDAASAQLEGSTYVMADEARHHFCVDAAHRQSYREDLVGASRTPPQSRQTRSTVANARRSFQVTFQCQCPSFVCELDHDVKNPRSAIGRVRIATRVVRLEPSEAITGGAGVIPRPVTQLRSTYAALQL